MKLTFLRLSLYGFLADRLLPDVQASEFVRASLARSLAGDQYRQQCPPACTC